MSHPAERDATRALCGGCRPPGVRCMALSNAVFCAWHPVMSTDMYERLEDDGGSIEDFLEALFLLGIAAGVGMTDVNAKQTGERSSRQARAS